MAHRMMILVSLSGLLHGQEIQPPSVGDCCQDGRDRGLRGQDCTILPLISSSHPCRIAQEQCCAAVVGDHLCDNGIKMAREQGACERHWETKISKMCCDCCTLGLMTALQGSSCELPGLLLGRQCTHAAKTCCGRNTTEEIKPTELGPVTEANVTAKPQVGSESCLGSSCSQLCVGNGTCVCSDGYHLLEDGVTCEDIDECLIDFHNCVLGQVCINTEGSFRCQRETSCGTGYELREGNICQDINECLIGVHTCVFGQVCINTEGSFRCQRETSCGTGYELRDDNICQDIDECSLGTHNCGPDFICTNTAGSFRCRPKEKCADGFIQDAIGSCIDINECVAFTSPCLPGQTCVNTLGSYTCRRNMVSCGRGYHVTEDGTRCEDVDECRVGNACGGHGCVNQVGSYRCECRAGYIFNSITKLCDDINECRHYPGRLCAHKCENTEGSYQCTCTNGFKLSHDGRSCEDINECDSNPCSQECANVHGSYQCYCRRGYQLSDIDGLTCEDIDECALPTGGQVCSYRCSNVPGSFYCTCPAVGYTLATNGRTCQDIDECAAGSHSCSVSEHCFNIQGGFRCLSYECPPNFRQLSQASKQDASFSTRCIKACKPNDISCTLDPIQLVTHIALSLPTFRDFSQPEDIVVLRMLTASNHPPQPGDTDVSFGILAADDQLSFDVQKRSHQGMIMGVVRQVKPITGPKDIVLEVAMNYVKSGVISHRNVVIISAFISEFWF